MKTLLSSLTLAAAALAVQPAAAQVAAVAPGAQINDTAGAAVGTITSVDGDFVVVKTDKYEVKLPANSFTPTEGALLFGMTQAQLNAEVEKAQVNPADLLVAGAMVKDQAGAHLGTVESVDAEFATVKLSAISVKLPVGVFSANAEGLFVGITAAELEAQAAAAAAATPL